MKRIRKPKSDPPPRFDPERHCGEMMTRRGKPVRCARLKGDGTSHAGQGRCSDHTDPIAANYYLGVRPTRLHYLLQRVREEGGNPSDILKELEILRAMTIAFIEDNSELDDLDAILQASDLLSKIMKGAQQYQQIQQAETIHIQAVQLIHIQMAEVVMKVIERMDPENMGSNWREKAIESIKSQWGAISIETNPREIKKLTGGGSNG